MFCVWSQHTVMLFSHPFTLSACYRQIGACRQLGPLLQGPWPGASFQCSCLLGQWSGLSSWAVGGVGCFQMAATECLHSQSGWQGLPQTCWSCRLTRKIPRLPLRPTGLGIWDQGRPRWGPGNPGRVLHTYHL